MRLLSIALVLVLVTIAGGAYHFWLSPASSNSEKIVFEVLPGEAGRRVIKRLSEQGLIKSEVALLVYARLTGLTAQIRVGEYELSPSMSPLQIKSILVSGKSVERSITFQEGLNIFEMADHFERSGFGKKEEFLSVAFDQQLVKTLLGESHSSLEGYLFPNTYQLDKYSGPRKLILEMVRNFQRVYSEVAEKNRFGFSKHELVTFASMIEKETGAPEERPIISSVFHNRIKKRMRFQSDPTIIYGMARRDGKMPFNISRKDITTPTPYNTYTVNGLPYGPIANPGREAMVAAVTPAQTDYLFFVSKNDGTHVFTTNYKDHNKAVDVWQRTRANREGRSWRDRTRSAGSSNSR